jgi:Mn-dependent DtxR family transcriptional regulator
VTRPELPADLRRFILTSIPSVPYLEAVLLVRAERGRDWSAAEVARRLYLPESQAAGLLQDLQSAGIVTEEAGRMRYAPATDELAAALDSLAAEYSVHLVVITDLIHSRVDKKARQFADAFRFRKDT